jgi:glycosyltransferase involved in cell wall biosynthesis
MKIYAVIPAFNNERTIIDLIERVRNSINHVLVIDDGSTDKTASLAENSGAHVIRVPKNRGKGNALRIAFNFALVHDLDAIITLDADLQHDPSEISKFIEQNKKDGSNIIIGNRLHGENPIPPIRYGPNRVGTILFSWLTGQTIKDSQCGFRLYDRKMMQNIRILNDGFEAEADILLRAGRRGYKIGFVPIQAIYFSDGRHTSYYRPIRDTFRISIIFLMNLFWKNR